ncbi:MAG: M48 family metalloprotease [Candidatus Hodarchaeota archaeon]
MSISNVDQEDDDKAEENQVSDEASKKKPKLITNFDPERRRLALSYTRISRRYSFGLMVVSFIVSLIVLILKITIELRTLISEYISEDPFILVGIFFIIGFLIVNVVELPISFYLHSRLSRRYGLSKLTNFRWFNRFIKASFIGFMISFPLFEGFYWLLRTFPETWWLWSTIILVIITVILSNLAPIVLLPRFYKFDPLEDEYPDLAEDLIKMSHDTGVKVTNAFVWRLGEIATVSNAALLGLGNTRRIIVADTMLENYRTEEIKWVLAHELGHHKHHDLWKGIILGTITIFIIFFLTHFMFLPLANFLGYPTDIADIGSFPVLGLSFWFISEVLINVPSLWYSRRVEQRTDAFASSLIPDIPIVKSLFIKMADQNLSDIDPPWWEKYFFMSHPPISERIRYAEERGNSKLTSKDM